VTQPIHLAYQLPLASSTFSQNKPVTNQQYFSLRTNVGSMARGV
jgi:hypothetical protein